MRLFAKRLRAHRHTISWVSTNFAHVLCSRHLKLTTGDNTRITTAFCSHKNHHRVKRSLRSMQRSKRTYPLLQLEMRGAELMHESNGSVRVPVARHLCTARALRQRCAAFMLCACLLQSHMIKLPRLRTCSAFAARFPDLYTPLDET